MAEVGCSAAMIHLLRDDAELVSVHVCIRISLFGTLRYTTYGEKENLSAYGDGSADEKSVNPVSKHYNTTLHELQTSKYICRAPLGVIANIIFLFHRW